MRVVVTSQGNDLDSPVDFRFGRCMYFIVAEMNDEIKLLEAIPNEANAFGGGAGVRAAQQVMNLKPDAIITGNLGPNAMAVLGNFNVPVYQGTSTVRESLQQLKENKLNKITSAVPGHYGLGRGMGRGLGRGRRWRQ